ncbi:MAG: phosphorylase family protein [Leucobacter sp.]
MSKQSALLVFAHEDEASAFKDVPHLVTGVGKINAVVSLTKALATGGIDRVVVLGTAGVLGAADEERPSLDTIYQVTTLLQHDFSLASPAIHTTGDTVLKHTTTMATGDQFITSDAQREYISGLGAQLVDMEGYAFASACERFGVPLQLFKIPSDYADSSTTMEEWDEIVVTKSQQLREFWDARLI